MNIHEYQAKQLLKQYGVSVPAGDPCKTVAEAKAAAERLFGAGHTRLEASHIAHRTLPPGRQAAG